MAQSEVCGNDYDKSFEVTLAGRTHVFDSFECAIHALAPVCAHCGCKIVGHGAEARLNPDRTFQFAVRNLAAFCSIRQSASRGHNF